MVLCGNALRPAGDVRFSVRVWNYGTIPFSQLTGNLTLTDSVTGGWVRTMSFTINNLMPGKDIIMTLTAGDLSVGVYNASLKVYDPAETPPQLLLEEDCPGLLRVS